MKKINNLDELVQLVGMETVEKCFTEYVMLTIAKAHKWDKIQEEEGMSDRELLIKRIKESGYEPQTDIETIADNVLLSYDPSESGKEFTIEGCLNYVDVTGGWAEFDSEF